MRVKERLDRLVDEGVIQRVIRPLMAGKEAEVYLVVHEGEVRVAKLYKDAAHRSFKHRSAYTEGRKVRNSRSARAMEKRSGFGRQEEEDAWKAAEVDCIYRLTAAGVRVPEPFVFAEGVLIMELIADENGEPAKRLVDLTPTPHEAEAMFHVLLREVVRMLLAGVVHGDLSDFNILMSEDGPVIIDFPQAVDPAHNNNARRLFLRDVKNITYFLGRWARKLRGTRYGQEIWALYEKNELTPETKLTGRFKSSSRRADTRSILAEISAAAEEENRRRTTRGQAPVALVDARSQEERDAEARKAALEQVAQIRARRAAEEAAQRAEAEGKKKKSSSPKKRRRKPAPGSAPEGSSPKKKRRRRRRRPRKPASSD